MDEGCYCHQCTMSEEEMAHLELLAQIKELEAERDQLKEQVEIADCGHPNACFEWEQGLEDVDEFCRWGAELAAADQVAEYEKSALAAHSEVLREALKDGAEILEELLDGPYYKAGWEALAKMKAALASSPAHSVRRWEKMRDVVEAARILSEFRPNTGFLKGEAIELNSALIEIRSALAALDNDDGEGKL